MNASQYFFYNSEKIQCALLLISELKIRLTFSFLSLPTHKIQNYENCSVQEGRSWSVYLLFDTADYLMLQYIKPHRELSEFRRRLVLRIEQFTKVKKSRLMEQNFSINNFPMYQDNSKKGDCKMIFTFTFYEDKKVPK